MQCELLYGDGTLEVQLPGRPKLLLPQKAKPVANPERAVREVLARPIGSAPFAESLRTTGKIAIIVNDETRVARTEIFLPILVEELNRIGVRDEQIFAVIANGTHRAMTRDEIRKKVSAFALERIRVYNHHSKTSPMVPV